ncbi:MAG: hypothetical protein QOK10_473 [Pseudonocardiales bacterium]|jgi:hypothetical protein|nr:hypothetical protein [Pseudonocardiales bacterium]
MSQDSGAAGRTSLAQRRTLLGLVLNASLLFRLPPFGYLAGTLVLLAAACGLLAGRGGRGLRAVLAPTVVVAAAGILDLITILTTRR